MAQTYDYIVGSYGEETEDTIHWLSFNAKENKFKQVSATNGIMNPSFVTVDHNDQYVFAVSELVEGEVVSYKINHETKTLTELSRQPTLGGPCFVEVMPNNKFLLTANFANGSIVVHPIKNGVLDAYTDYENYMKEAEQLDQDASHVHAIRHIPETDLFIATDLGLNRLCIYHITDQGEIRKVNDVTLPDHSGPRHIDFHPDKKIIYVVNEFNSTVCIYSYNEKATKIELKQVIRTIDKGFEGDNYGADIHVTSSGEYVLVSNRGHHSITSYLVEDDGRLKEVDNYKLQGEWPRNFTIIPNDEYVLVANEHSDSIEVLTLTAKGNLIKTDNIQTIRKPVCLQVLNARK